MKHIFFIIMMMYGLLCHADISKHILGNNETDNRSVFHIQKDGCGYMWFLSRSGVNRYDGICLRHYDLRNNNPMLDLYPGYSWLCTDSQKNIWVVSKDGNLLLYDRTLDKFGSCFDLRKSVKVPLTWLGVDGFDNGWFCNEKEFYICHLPEKKVYHIPHGFGNISKLIFTAGGKYYISSKRGVFSFSLVNNTLTSISADLLAGRFREVYDMLYMEAAGRLVVADYNEGIGICDSVGKLVYTRKDWKDNRINCIKSFGKEEFLIATDGIGVFSMNVKEYQIKQFLYTDFEGRDIIRSNRIADLFVDEQQRVWVADFPDGVTVYNKFLSDGCEWYRHVAGDSRSLVNNRVNAIICDSERDVWFATDNGICCYSQQTGQWKHVQSDLICKRYTSLCELAPGVICAGNSMHGLYIIRKRKMIVSDKYAGISSVNIILRKDKSHLWIGTDSGLFILSEKDKALQNVELSARYRFRINSLYQDEEGRLYVGTEGQGLYVVGPGKSQIEVYGNDDIRNISLIFPDEDRLVIATNKELYGFDRVAEKFYRLAGGISQLTSGASLGCGCFMLGTSCGAYRFDKNTFRSLCSGRSDIYWNDLKIYHQLVTVDTEDSPLKQAINYTKVLELEYNQNTFSFTVSSVNYDRPENIVYTWKLNDSEWNTPAEGNVIHFSNLAPGEYLVSVRALSAENGNPVSQRTMKVIVHPPLWLTEGAFLCYGMIALLLGTVFVRAILIWRERDMAREMIRVFVQAAHNVCMPLTLIKNPLENLSQKYSSETLQNVLQQIKKMDSVFSDLITIGNISSHPEKLSLVETELNTYLDEIFSQVLPMTEQKKIKLHWSGTPGFLHIWLDKDKMNAILNGLFEMVTQCLNVGEDIELTTACTSRHWEMKFEFAINDCFKKKF